ncbi:flagellar biosynthesis protein FlgL [Rugamonas rubra]|uniref:Flagellar hook-associated protein 3 FlgL n=1 Tax=Rugamonas rubra TaxID=758825 RepID=A0A1I4IU82_9BURK|nr:flagellar biosynthesis protein FlgL [Rugamonas rubra]SFL57902.1 flagellar hook-associated protein 3 FlgL [Rugamonas rubra]
MRIATNQFQSTMLRGLNLNQEGSARQTDLMASGNKLQLPSDDPVTNVRISRLNREEAIVGQYKANIGAVQIRLQKNETYLTSMTKDINSARDLMVWGLDASNTGADLGAMVNSFTSIRDSLFYSANVKDQEGRFIFSGTATNSDAISFDAAAPVGSRYTFSGNTNQQKVVVGNGINQTANVDVSGLETYLNQLDTTIAELSAPGITASTPSLRAALTAGLDGSDVALGAISSKIADFGGAQNILATLNDNHTNVSLSNGIALIQLGKLDYAEAATELGGYNLALEASYKAYAKVSGLSLFNVL